jgi:hemerythrin
MNWEWTSSLETGIEEIDEQHKELFNRIDKLELAIYKGRAAIELESLMKYLESYIIEHFEMEEQLMLDHIYPDFAAHARQHNEFRNIFTGILESCRNRGADSYLAIDVDKQMRKWWENHILKMDMAYIPFLKNR